MSAVGTAGHHGLDSIVRVLWTTFTRVRVGVGRPPHGADAAELRICRVQPDEQPLIQTRYMRAADAVECVLREGDSRGDESFNVRTSRATAPRDT